MLTELTSKPKVVGAKQVRRAVEAGRAVKVFVARDADPRVTEPILRLCADKGVEICPDAAMKEIGAACGISVGSAVAAVVTA